MMVVVRVCNNLCQQREYVELTVKDNTAGTLATTQRPIDDDLRLNLGPQLAVHF